MPCPACQQAIPESSAACPHCGFTLASLDRYLGIPPQLTSTIADFTETLTKADRSALIRLAEDFERRFPQCGLIFATCTPPQGVPLAAYVFWLFNHNQVGSALEKGAANRQIMLAVDPVSRKFAATIGYGLEPFVSAAALHEALQAGAHQAGGGEFALGFRSAVSHLQTTLVQICESAPIAFGLDGEWLDSADQLSPYPRHHAWSY